MDKKTQQAVHQIKEHLKVINEIMNENKEADLCLYLQLTHEEDNDEGEECIVQQVSCKTEGSKLGMHTRIHILIEQMLHKAAEGELHPAELMLLKTLDNKSRTELGAQADEHAKVMEA